MLLNSGRLNAENNVEIGLFLLGARGAIRIQPMAHAIIVSHGFTSMVLPFQASAGKLQTIFEWERT